MTSGTLRRSRVAERLERELKEQIGAGQLKPGDLLLSMSELGARYGLKRPTVQKALGRLEAEGYLRARAGSGLFVSDGFKRKTVRLYASASSALGSFLDVRFDATGLDVRRVAKRAEADVVVGSGGTARWLEQRGAVLPLDGLLAGGELADPAGWVPELADLYRFGGHTYGLPVWGSPLVVFINQSLFKRAGVVLPGADWTWDDFSAAVRQLRPVCDLERAGVFPTMDMFTMYVPFVVQNGGGIFAWDGRCRLVEEPALETIAFLRGVRRAAGGTPCGGYEELAERFLGGGCAMAMWSGLLLERLAREHPFEWGWLPLPRRGVKATLAFSEGLMIAAGSEAGDAAWGFLRECVTADAQRHFEDRSLPLPARRSAVESFVGRHGPDYGAFLAELGHAVTEHYRYGPDVFNVLVHEMRGVLEPGLTEDAVREKCVHTSRVAESLIRAREGSAEGLLLA